MIRLLRSRSLLFLVACCVASAPHAVAGPTHGRNFYVNCGAPAAGDGTSPQSAWNSLAGIDAVTFGPGDTIRLRRGTECSGVLAPKGSGAEGAPIRLTAYGSGPRPKLVARRQSEEALRLFNQEYWDIDSLDIAGGNTYGISISGDKGILHHIHLSNLLVHDVLGDKMTHKESGLVSISPGDVNQHFDDVLVDNVQAWNTNQWVGILVGGGNLGYPPESDWSTNVVIRNSTVHDVQGDGIVLFRVRKGLIVTSVAWNTGMQNTESIGTPNAIWTWMCDDCTVRENEAYLTDSPGVDGGAYDIDYGNTKNSVIDNYGHDTQGYCVAVFGAGFVTRQSTVRGNLCINNGRSPRMADYQGAIFLLSWNGGSIDGLDIEENTVYWNPFENAPALLNEAQIKAGSATFRNNAIYSASPSMVDSNTSLSFARNHYSYFGAGHPDWRYGKDQFDSVAKLESGGSSARQPLEQWAKLFGYRREEWRLSCVLPISLDAQGAIDDAALQQIVVLRSMAQQYRPKGLRVVLQVISPDAQLFNTEAFRNAMSDLGLAGIVVHESIAGGLERTTLTSSSGGIAARWNGFAGPVQLGLALRRAMGEPVFSQIGVKADE